MTESTLLTLLAITVALLTSLVYLLQLLDLIEKRISQLIICAKKRKQRRIDRALKKVADKANNDEQTTL